MIYTGKAISSSINNFLWVQVLHSHIQETIIKDRIERFDVGTRELVERRDVGFAGGWVHSSMHVVQGLEALGVAT